MLNNKKRLLFLLLISSYILAITVNFMPSIKFPDLQLYILNLAVSILFAASLLIYTTTGSKRLILFSAAGAISVIIIFIVTTFEEAIFENVLLDVIASVQFPLYILYATPLFGGNLIFHFPYETYSIFLALFYITAFLLALYYKKKSV